MPRKERAAKMGLSVTTATSAVGSVTRKDERHAELQQGQNGNVDKSIFTVDWSTGYLPFHHKYLKSMSLVELGGARACTDCLGHA
mmetsp:Transcript_2131/g.3904  ORF Transcript_2131/g.3904 Transcript_2131/m.3904 type:complete len:85 (+) Transcript_2131:821-1075(+)